MKLSQTVQILQFGERRKLDYSVKTNLHFGLELGLGPGQML